MKGRRDVKNKQQVISVTVLLNLLFSACLSVVIFPFYILLRADRDGTLQTLFCCARGFWRETRRLEEEGCFSFLLCSSASSTLALAVLSRSGLLVFSTSRPASSLLASHTRVPGQLAPLLWAELCPLKAHIVDALTPSMTAFRD